jgi:ATP synthase protein I
MNASAAVVSIDAAQARRMAYSVVLWQGAVTVVVALVSYGFAGRLAAVSALIGGGISTLASLVMAAFSFRRSSLANAYNAVRGFYVGEAAKLATVVVLFVFVLRTMKVSPLAMFAAYVATFFVYWVALANALPSLGPPKDKADGDAVAARRPR